MPGRRKWFGWLLGAYVLYALGFILNSSVSVNGCRYFVLLDDAMISMTYARNLARGHGAVWYPGVEPVQGYSNPLWMLYMAAAHLLPLSPPVASLPIQLTGIALLGGTLFFVKGIAERLGAESQRGGRGDREVSMPSRRPMFSPLLAVLLTAFYLPLNNWTLRGMEVGLLALGTSAAVWAAMNPPREQPYRWWLLPLLGLLTTIRMDAAVIGATLLAWLICTTPRRRWQTFLMGIAWLALFLIAQLLVQNLYYHDWLPNTYYLKLGGSLPGQRVLWGGYVLYRFVLGMGISPLMLAALPLIAAPQERHGCYSS